MMWSAVCLSASQ